MDNEKNPSAPSITNVVEPPPPPSNNNIEQISGDSNEDALSTLVDIMVDLDTHYKADDDIHVLKEIGNVSCKVEAIIKEKEIGPREMIKQLSEEVNIATNHALRPEPSQRFLERRASLEKDIEDIALRIQKHAQEERATLTSIEALEMKLSEVKRRQAKLQNQGAVDAPRVKYALSLYGNISNIVWDYTSDNVKGIITSPYGGPVTNFNIDPSSCTAFEITNRLWGLSNC
jgi:hypothetical protein